MDYDDGYATCAKTYATLRIYPGSIDPSEVTRRLEITPSVIRRKGERRKKDNPRSVSKINAWFLTSQSTVISKDTRRHIDWLIDQVVPRKDALLTLQQEGVAMDISNYWLSQHGDGGPALSPKQMTGLIELNLEIWWDCYFCGEDD